MHRKNIVITQSNYIPWKGYFDALQIADEFILYDDVQYTKRDWRNRNKIKTPQGLQWLTIPVEVKGKYFQSIKDTKVSDARWRAKHWKTIKANYSKAEYFRELEDTIANLYTEKSTYLSEINHRFITNISALMGFSAQVRFSSEFQLVEGKTERLIDLCKQLGGTDYYTGFSAKNYLDEALFRQESIRLHYFDFTNYPTYPQLHGAFEHHVSIIDLLLNVGAYEAPSFLKFTTP